MQTGVPTVGEMQALVEQFTTVEARLAVSAALLLGTLAVAWFVLPHLVGYVARAISRHLFTGQVADTAELVGDHAPTTLGRVLLRSVQLAALIASVVGVLLVWGLTDLVRETFVYVYGQIPLIGQIVGSIVLFVAASIGARVLADSVSSFSDQTEWMTDHQEEIVLRVSQLTVFVIGGLVLLTIWGLQLGGLLVGAGFLGIVLGFAARQTLGSLIAGFVLMFSRPFTIGDWVEVGDREGIVTDITIFNTRLENFDGEFVILPNDKVSNSAITNRSRKGLLRLRIDVGIDYESDPDHAREVAMDTISDLSQVVDAPPPQVVPKSFGDSAVVLEMRFWIDHPTPPRKWRAISQVIQAVKEAFEREGVKIPYPQRELSGRAETGGFRIHDDAGPSLDREADRPGVEQD
jgi:small-conductance mechanosensitive channel